jgi:hypothetical protein
MVLHYLLFSLPRYWEVWCLWFSPTSWEVDGTLRWEWAEVTVGWGKGFGKLVL